MQQADGPRPGIDLVRVARILLLAELVALMVSTSAAVGGELLLYPLFLGSGVLRGRLVRTLGQPMIRMALLWAGMLLLAAFYCIAPAAEVLDSLGSWRKLLLLPMAAAVFDETAWKLRLVWTLVLTATLGVALSYFSWFSGVGIYKYSPGITISNHATQGMMFAVSLFAMALLARYSRPEQAGWPWWLGGAGLATFANLIFITPGRSGYLALMILALVAAFFLVPGRARYLAALATALVLGALLFFSPVASQRIKQGVSEINTYQQSAELTSMGIRRHMWNNTLQMIRVRPLLGVGTGGFSAGYRQQVAGQTGWQGQPVDDCHNQYLRILAEQGVVGLLVFLALLWSFFRQPVGPPYRIIGLGVLLAWCATSLFSAHFSTFMEGRFIYLWCGALLAQAGEAGAPV
ncbi:MAG: O-antigen ligase family protein [Desulfobulbaceae bacterium]|nr:O-antigen ligase family protein [Desulfobulbaceae bacterium]